jgi:type IV pilus assembly protein PilV
MSSLKTQSQSLRHSAGFSLVEAMVALVVLSVGMIGIAALHGQGLSASRTALNRTIAINLSADMADRIRVNRIGQAAYNNAAADNGCGPEGGGIDCTPAEMAQHDLFVWGQQVQQLLPNGLGQVQFSNLTNPPTYTITVFWDEVGAEVNPISHQLSFQQPAF